MKLRSPPQMAKSVVVYNNSNPMMSESHKRKRATVENLYDTSQAQSSVLEKAKEVEAILDHKFPTLLRIMLPSHVTGGFWLGLPKKFCCKHLPKYDSMIVLEDESGDEFQIKYLAEKVGLSGGWKGFSIAHNLLEGDIVIFHLVTPTKFKVYIVRSNGLDEMDCALGLMRLEAGITKMNTGEIIAYEREESGNLNPISEDNAITFITESTPISDQSENDSEDLGFEVLDGLRFSGSVVTFKELKCVENFSIVVNGSNINSEFSKHLLTKYYKLCCSQNSFLHERLHKGLNCKLVSGVISETINIADAIRECNITTLDSEFCTWDRTLNAFEHLGMNVGFLRARLDKLACIASKLNRFKKARLEKYQAEEDMRSLEAKLFKVKEAVNRLNSEFETPNLRLVRHELKFQELAKAPW